MFKLDLDVQILVHLTEKKLLAMLVTIVVQVHLTNENAKEGHIVLPNLFFQ